MMWMEIKVIFTISQFVRKAKIIDTRLNAKEIIKFGIEKNLIPLFRIRGWHQL